MRMASGSLRVADRASASYQNHDKECGFLVKHAAFHQQFANLYFTRLSTLAPEAQEAARKLWGRDINFVKTLDAEPGVNVVVVGTLYKDMAAKPDILKEVLRDALQTGATASEAQVQKYCGDGDKMSIEDDSGRITLSGSALQDPVLVTGAVIAVLGELGPDGVLQIEEVCYPGLPPQPPMPLSEDTAGRHVALISGLQIGRSDLEMQPLMLLSEYLTGQLGGLEDHQQQAAIVRLIIAGNTMCDPQATAASSSDTPIDALKKTSAAEQHSLGHYVSAMDTFLTTVSAAMPVDLMPGSNDPCNYLLPQQPLHKCLLQQSSRLSSIGLCTNPHRFTVAGVNFLGSSGQPLDDMQRYLPDEDRLRTLTKSLHMRHVAPTAPDTLGCYPFSTEDPFVIKDCPHVYFAGNQPHFASELVEGPDGQRVRVVAVPDFCQDPTCVLVNLSTLECRPLSFGGLA